MRMDARRRRRSQPSLRCRGARRSRRRIGCSSKGTGFSGGSLCREPREGADHRFGFASRIPSRKHPVNRVRLVQRFLMPNRRSYRALAAVAMAVVLGFGFRRVRPQPRKPIPNRRSSKRRSRSMAACCSACAAPRAFRRRPRRRHRPADRSGRTRSGRRSPASVRTGTSEGLTAIFAGSDAHHGRDAGGRAARTSFSHYALRRLNEARIRSAIVDYRAARTPERITRATVACRRRDAAVTWSPLRY